MVIKKKDSFEEIMNDKNYEAPSPFESQKLKTATNAMAASLYAPVAETQSHRVAASFKAPPQEASLPRARENSSSPDYTSKAPVYAAQSFNHGNAAHPVASAGSSPYKMAATRSSGAGSPGKKPSSHSQSAQSDYPSPRNRSPAKMQLLAMQATTSSA